MDNGNLASPGSPAVFIKIDRKGFEQLRSSIPPMYRYCGDAAVREEHLLLLTIYGVRLYIQPPDAKTDDSHERQTIDRAAWDKLGDKPFPDQADQTATF